MISYCVNKEVAMLIDYDYEKWVFAKCFEPALTTLTSQAGQNLQFFFVFELNKSYFSNSWCVEILFRRWYFSVPHK